VPSSARKEEKLKDAVRIPEGDQAFTAMGKEDSSPEGPNLCSCQVEKGRRKGNPWCSNPTAYVGLQGSRIGKAYSSYQGAVETRRGKSTSGKQSKTRSPSRPAGKEVMGESVTEKKKEAIIISIGGTRAFRKGDRPQPRQENPPKYLTAMIESEKAART